MGIVKDIFTGLINAGGKLLKLYLFFSFLNGSWAYSPREIGGKKNWEEYSQIKEKVGQQKQKLNVIQKSILNLEAELKKNNELFLKNIEATKKLELEMERIKGQLEQSEKGLKQTFLRSQKIFSQFILNEIDEDYEIENLIQKKLFKDVLLENFKAIGELTANNKDLLEKLKGFQEKIDFFRSKENALSNLIYELEDKKKNLSKEFVKEEDSSENVQNKLNGVKLTELKKKVPLDNGISGVEGPLVNNAKEMIGKKEDELSEYLKFGSVPAPVLKFQEIKHNQKGITFFIKERSPILSVGKGAVAYAGPLSNYGNVIIIDHDKDYKSVILGNFLPKIEKGTLVEEGEVLGYTDEQENEVKSVYFEIRKKDLVLDTIFWLDKKILGTL